MFAIYPRKTILQFLVSTSFDSLSVCYQIAIFSSSSKIKLFWLIEKNIFELEHRGYEPEDYLIQKLFETRHQNNLIDK